MSVEIARSFSPGYVQGSIAQSYVYPVEKSPKVERIPFVCGSWAVASGCESGHVLAVSIDCKKEWCQVPGCKKRTHETREKRWWKKGKQIGVMGHITINFHPFDRPQTREAWRKLRRQIIRGLKLRGFNRGLGAWHWFGESKEGEKPIFEPHLHFLPDCLGSGYLKPGELVSIKKMILKVTGLKKVYVNYRYSKQAWKKRHWVRYVTRATFLNKEWDKAMANELEGEREWDEEKEEFKSKPQFKNFISWGKWGYEDYFPQDLKSLEQKLEDLREDDDSRIKLSYVAKVEKGICPVCDKKLKKINILQIDDLEELGFERIRANIWQKKASQKEVLDYSFLRMVDRFCREERSPPCEVKDE